MPNLRIIMLSGESGSGKDTVADFLRLHHGYAKISQGDSIRSLFNDINGQSWELRKDYDGTRGARGSEDSRAILRTIGTDCVANVLGRPDEESAIIWAYLALIKIDYLHRHHSAPHDKFVISDIRWTSQLNVAADYCRKYDGQWRSYRVHCPGSNAVPDHVTESSVQYVPHDDTIVNMKKSKSILFNDIEKMISLEPEFA